jgi:hypothetical protein
MKKLALVLISALISITASSPSLAQTILSEGETNSVSIVRGSTINLVARESSVPVVVNNTLAGEVRVVVNLRSNSPKLNVLESSLEVVVPAGTSVNAQFPVKAIGSGNVVLVAWLTGLNGEEIGKRVPLKMTVNPDIETTAIVLFLSFVGVLIVIGVYRTLKRRRNL